MVIVETIEPGKEYLKKDWFESFIRENEEYADMELKRFTKWIKDAAQIRGKKTFQRRSDKERYIRIDEK